MIAGQVLPGNDHDLPTAARGYGRPRTIHGLRETGAYDPELVDYVDLESASDRPAFA
jgi:hypothetical protein